MMTRVATAGEAAVGAQQGRADAAVGRAGRGLRAHLSGQVAEESVARHYARDGRRVARRRWRGAAGEIDLIVQDGDGYVFVEVKTARTFDAAAVKLGRRQVERIMAAACEYMGTFAGGQLATMRFDLALVDGRGEVSIIENAFGQD
jgi:putative endonuclease